MKVKVIKKTVMDGVPKVLYLVFKDTRYIATVELQCFSLKCEILDSEHKLDTDELCEINLAVLKKIQEEFTAQNITTDKMVPPPLKNLFKA